MQSHSSQDTDDLLLPLAAQLVIDKQFGSTAYLQRNLKIGYARAYRLMETMTYLGILGPFNGSKPREVLMSQEEAISTIQKAISKKKDK